MPIIQPDLKWYVEISANKSLPPRCPFASAQRCPRYHASLSLLGEKGVTTAVNPQEDKRLQEMWKSSNLSPVTAEQDTGVGGQPGRPSIFSNFCPEVSFDTFGWFASDLSRYTDEIDVDNAHGTLGKEGVTAEDWRWVWSAAVPMHYTGCPLYSLLRLGANETKSRSKIGFGS